MPSSSMIQKSFQSAILRALPTVEHQCQCRCGAHLRTWRPFSTTAPHREPRKAWTTKEKYKRVYSPDLKRQRQEIADLEVKLDHAMRNQAIEAARSQNHVLVTPQQATQFIDGFTQLCKSEKNPGVASFQKFVGEHNLEQNDMLYIAILMFTTADEKANKSLGQQLMALLSAVGYEEATIKLLHWALLDSPRKPRLLKHAQLAKARGHLQSIVRAGTNSRAMVLEGKIAEQLGDQDTAISLWWSAVKGSIGFPERMEALRAAGGAAARSVWPQMQAEDLTSPWIELIVAYDSKPKRTPKEEQKLVEALELGMQQDDPKAFYWAGTYYKEYSTPELDESRSGQQRNHKPTSKWLYYMTKAAASGVPQAAHALGEFYCNSGWKYIEDEPPDHVKPTPFDSYPGPGDTPLSLWQRLIGRAERPPGSEADNIFHTAAFPSTPRHRAELAMYWLGVATLYMYAPSFLVLAEFCNLKSLWAGAQAPKSALELSTKRYAYSRAEAEEGVYGEDVFANEVRQIEDNPLLADPPNPFYDVDRVKELLVEVFRAHRAVAYKNRTTARADGRMVNDFTAVGVDEWETALRDNFNKPKFFKFYSHDDVYDSWQGQADWLYQQAANICDREGWTLYDETNALVYKAGVGVSDNLDKIGPADVLMCRRMRH